MSKTRFRLLVFFMSLSLIGIILVQLYWINSSFKGNSEQFRFNVQQVLSKVTGQLKDQEKYGFFDLYRNIGEKEGRRPTRADFVKYRLNSEGRFVLQNSTDDGSGVK